MKRSILIPCGGFDTHDDNPLWELLFIPEGELSVREKAKIEEALNYGDLIGLSMSILKASSGWYLTSVLPKARSSWSFQSTLN